MTDGDMDRIATRRAGPGDVDVVRRITRAAYARWIPLIGREPKPMTADYALALERHRVDLLLEDDSVIGLIETVVEADALLIENVAVLPAHQRHGWGGRLLGLAEQIAQAHSLRRVRLYTNRRFVENIRLYARLGYGVDREEVSAAGVAVHMSKSLEAMGPGDLGPCDLGPCDLGRGGLGVGEQAPGERAAPMNWA